LPHPSFPPYPTPWPFSLPPSPPPSLLAIRILPAVRLVLGNELEG
jgi:hypothetical protein